jgi:hypothetical protein
VEDAVKEVLEGVVMMAAGDAVLVEVAVVDAVVDGAVDGPAGASGVGSSLVLVVAGTEIDVDVVSTRVEEDVVVVVVEVMAPSPNEASCSAVESNEETRD